MSLWIKVNNKGEVSTEGVDFGRTPELLYSRPENPNYMDVGAKLAFKVPGYLYSPNKGEQEWQPVTIYIMEIIEKLGDRFRATILLDFPLRKNKDNAT